MNKITQTSGKRIRTFFAFLPISIDIDTNHKETRWLEKVTIEEEFVPSQVSILGEYFEEYWLPIKFIDKNDIQRNNR